MSATDTLHQVADEAWATTEEALKEARQAAVRSEEAESRAKAAEERVVELEKVATQLGAGLSSLADTLVEIGFLDEGDRDEQIKKFASDPATTGTVLRNLIDRFSAASGEGVGFPKAAKVEKRANSKVPTIEELREREDQLWRAMAAKAPTKP